MATTTSLSVVATTETMMSPDLAGRVSYQGMAADRGHPDLAPRLDALHPAVLRLISFVCDAAARERKPVAVCGGLASDASAAALLVGLGVSELSAVPAMIPRLKALVKARTLDECRGLAQRALALENAAAVRALAGEPS